MKDDNFKNCKICEYENDCLVDYKWEQERWIKKNLLITFKRDGIIIENCKIIDYDCEFDMFIIDKIDGYIPIENLYWNGLCLNTYE